MPAVEIETSEASYVTRPLAFGNVAVACQGTATAHAASTWPTVQQGTETPERGKPKNSDRHLTHHQIPHGLPWQTTRAFMVSSRRELLDIVAKHRSTLHTTVPGIPPR